MINPVYLIARSFGTFLKKKNVTEAIVGHDARSTSESFHANVIKALNECGINVIDIGTVTTPMSYWAQFHFKIKGLVMVTASHNPVGWNGVKLGCDLAYTLLTDEINDIYDTIINESFEDGEFPGTVRQEDILDAYISDLLSRVNVTKKFKVLLNTGNGTAGLLEPTVFKRLGCDVVEHFTNIDPTYPNYTANPDGTAMMEDTGKQTSSLMVW